MAAILPIIAQLLPLLPSLTTGVGQLIGFIGSIRAAAQQSGEWTPELEKAFVDALIARNTDPAWRPDAK